MRGLRLFVRPIEAADHPAVNSFLERNASSGAAPACGLLGKLIGDIVAVVALDITEDALRVVDVTVSRELRKKWIGRVMMREVEQLAAKMDRHRIIVEDARDAHEFFRRVGFESEGERWVRVLPS
ncbi:MAG TPA: GNAT family N-acetyltransferase [Thermoanaerobaculia bacterium]|nr:GNAT family N-acetyltransferase [Thermoanaerobaculia bacterium]